MVGGNVKDMRKKEISWRIFEKYFRQKYLCERYYDNKVKEFHEHKLRQLTVDEYTNRFLELLRYVPYIVNEKVKIKGTSMGYHKLIETQLSLMSQEH